MHLSIIVAPMPHNHCSQILFLALLFVEAIHGTFYVQLTFVFDSILAFMKLWYHSAISQISGGNRDVFRTLDYAVIIYRDISVLSRVASYCFIFYPEWHAYNSEGYCTVSNFEREMMHLQWCIPEERAIAEYPTECD